MRTTTAYFAGVGTVIAAIAAGLGGGLVLGNIMSPQQPKHPSSEVTRLEQRATQPIPAIAGVSQPVPYLATAQNAASTTEPSAQTEPQPAPSQSAQKPDTVAVQSAAASAQPVAADQNASRERAAPEASYARVREGDVKREVRRADDRRKAERRQQWAERQRMKQRGDDELRDVEEKVREVTESRPLFSRGASFGTRINLLDD